MILPDFKAFPRTGRIVGIDWGQRRIGVAISDPSREFIFARDAIVLPHGAENHAELVEKIVTDEGATAIIVGLPLHADGSDSDTTKMVRAFVERLSGLTDLPIGLIEENLTSHVAQENMGRVRVRDLKKKLDSESARVILENAIALINRA